MQPDVHSEDEPVKFEDRDLEIFRIPDLRTRLNTLKNYFSPRLERLLMVSVQSIREIYQIDPYRLMTHTYRPKHRTDSTTNIDTGSVHIGLCGKRTANAVFLNQGSAKHRFPPSMLRFQIFPEGSIRVVLSVCIYRASLTYFDGVRKLFADNDDGLMCMMMQNHISYNRCYECVPFRGIFTEGSIDDWRWVTLSSPKYYFPLDGNRGLLDLHIAFVALYPILESLVEIAIGQPPSLGILLDRLQSYIESSGDNDEIDDDNSADAQSVEIDLPELNNYRIIRAGLWWSVLARDSWTCCSCGRSAKLHAVTLHVDHIMPRSRGGTDDAINLQTLCMKCNLGKSNRDTTDLRK